MATNCISREIAIEELYKLPCKMDEDGYRWVLSRDVAHMIDELPDAEVIPFVLGEWLETEDSYADPPKQQTCMCSVCKVLSKRPLGDFCRWCGACMLKVEQEQEYEF